MSGKYINYTVGLGFEDLRVGMKIEGHPVTVTESHIVTFAGLSGDYNPLHVDEEFARKTVFGTRIAHGLLVMSIASGSLGMVFAGTAVALVGFKGRFIKPVRIGDTIRPVAEVISLEEKPEYNGGIVKLKLSVINQKGETVAEGEATLIVTKSSR